MSHDPTCTVVEAHSEGDCNGQRSRRVSTETTRNIHVVLIDDEVATFALLTLGEGATLGQKLQAEYGARRVYIVTASHLPMGLAETLDAVHSSQDV